MPWQEHADTFEHVENGISTINRLRDKAVGPLQDHLLAKPTQNLQVEVCHDLDRAITFEHVENGNSTVNSVRDIVSGPLPDHLLAKPDQNLQCECWHDLGRGNTFEHVENDNSTIYIVRYIASGPLQDHLLSQPNRKWKIGLHSPEELVSTFQTSYQPVLYDKGLSQKSSHKMCVPEKKQRGEKWCRKHNPSAFDYMDAKANSIHLRVRWSKCIWRKYIRHLMLFASKAFYI